MIGSIVIVHDILELEELAILELEDLAILELEDLAILAGSL